MTRTAVQENAHDLYVSVFDGLDEGSDAGEILRGDVSKYYTTRKKGGHAKMRWEAGVGRTFDLDVNRGRLLQELVEVLEISLRGCLPER